MAEVNVADHNVNEVDVDVIFLMNFCDAKKQVVYGMVRARRRRTFKREREDTTEKVKIAVISNIMIVLSKNKNTTEKVKIAVISNNMIVLSKNENIQLKR